MPGDSSDRAPHHNLLALQRIAALKLLDREIAAAWAADYGTETDALLERRHALLRQLRDGYPQ
jgi:hypothetical protein